MAQSEPDSLAECAQITDDTQRLYCFDQLSKETLSAQEPQPLAISQEGKPVLQTKPAGLDSRSIGRDFGLETTTEYKQDKISSISANIDGSFKGWSGATYFHLDNGQIWQQSDGTRVVFNTTNPTVTIRRGAFGSYRLSVDGLNRSVRVRRVE